MQVTYHPEAEQELRESARFYESRLAGLCDEFLDAVNAAVHSILADPERFPVVEDDIRRCRVKRFPFCIYFRFKTDAIRILVVKHHSRHPDYWKHRRD